MINREVIRMLGLITQVGLSMITPVLLCVFFGVKLDQWFDTHAWFIPMLLLGIAAGIRNVYMLIYKNRDRGADRQGETADGKMEQDQ